MNESLQVVPADLRSGGTQFEARRAAMKELLTSADQAHTDLQAVWEGSAADVLQEQWDEHMPTVSAHVAQLEEHARLLTSTAADYEDTETFNRGNIQAAGESSVLNLEV